MLLAVLTIAAILMATRETNEDKALQQVTKLLVDPQSAIFQEVTTKRNGAVCGRVNSKNGFGGYGGWKSFGVSGGQVVIRTENLDPQSFEDNRTYQTMCL
jgi:hypothetical protein